ncbi:glycosyltransferase family 2 protein [Lactiplantibacillus xiangfangensis]|uniref:Glycosyltransferase n=1 Tax=Lactiplantibacillus xiangfangensis TaxID=942150 RepID=A0A0R2MS37_9LACO|nr:glycosyltransferase family 2 protein [Lactiplantibacillus xiangfangensis]KRO14621.1 glycosyltransferase [Lactiplantibacillus xiangfangensis]
MNKIACVIVTYNREKLMVEALRSVLSQEQAPEYVFVVDNASTDGVAETLHQTFDFDQSHLYYYRSPENLGGSAGFSRGISLALETDCNWVSISDDDAIFQPGYFVALRRAIERHPRQNVFSGSVLLPNGKHDALHREMIINGVTLTTRPVDEALYGKDFWYDIFSFVGVLLSREMLERIGLPEKNYFIRFDDFEYALRARKSGSFLNVHDAQILHKTNYTRTSIAPWKEYYVMRNRIVSLFKYSGKNLKTRWFCCRFLCRKLVAIGLFRNRWGQAFPLIRAYLSGYHDGFQGHLGRNLNYLPR